MEKIPTLFERDDTLGVTLCACAGCEWVLAGEGAATEKLDGTNVRLTVRSGQLKVSLEKRRNPTKVQKKQGIKDGWYVDADEFGLPRIAGSTMPRDRPTSLRGPMVSMCARTLGPSVQGNPLGLAKHVCLPFNVSPLCTTTFRGHSTNCAASSPPFPAGIRRGTPRKESSSITPTAAGQDQAEGLPRVRHGSR